MVFDNSSRAGSPGPRGMRLVTHRRPYRHRALATPEPSAIDQRPTVAPNFQCSQQLGARRRNQPAGGSYGGASWPRMTVKRGAGVRLTLVSIAVPYAEPRTGT